MWCVCGGGGERSGRGCSFINVDIQLRCVYIGKGKGFPLPNSRRGSGG